MIIMIRFLFSVCFLAMATGQQEPCTNYISITDERRSIRYTAPATEPNICDRNINEDAWYRFQVLLPQRIHDACVAELKCGTEQPVWIRGTHPTAAEPGPKEVDACSPRGNDCCGGWTAKISIKFCRATAADGGDYYVYRLKQLPRCDMAYCAGDGDICKKGTAWNPNSRSCTEPRPNIAVPVFEGPVTIRSTTRGIQPQQFDDFYFACKIQWTNPDELKKGEQFEVVFTFDGVQVPSVNPKITDGSNLEVRLLSKELKGHVGKTVGCKVRSYWKMVERFRGEYQAAKASHFVGIRYSTSPGGPFTSPRIEIDEKSPALTLYFQSTVPVSCPATMDGTACKFTVEMADISKGIGVVLCSITFSGLDSGKAMPTQMIKAQATPGIKNRVSVIRFKPIDVNPAFFWHMYKMQDVNIAVKDTSTSKICWSTGDPHITTFDGRYYHVYTEGDYILAKSTERHFEVHVRHHKCAAVTCNCAVAVREGNNVIGINACQGPTFVPTPIRYLMDRNVPGTTITNIANTYTITMPSGAYLTAAYYPWHGVMFFNLQLYLNSEDYGKTSGLCGVWNGNPNDDTVIRGTTTNVPIPVPRAFSDSYKLAPEKSFINGHARPIECLNITGLVPNICSCKADMAVTCTTPDSTTATFNTRFSEHCTPPPPPPTPAFRKRRDVDSSNETDEEKPRQKDMMMTEEDIPMPEFDEKHGVDVTLSWPTRSGITETQASRQCRTEMESSPVYQMCKDRMVQDTEKIMTNCVSDVQIMDDLGIAAQYVANEFQRICVHQLEILVVSDDSSVPSPMEVLLAEVKSAICPNQCNGNGTCRNGTCVCNSGFAGEDCSVNALKPPQLTSFRKESKCDFRSSYCLEISIFASNFFRSDKFSCKVIAVDHSRHFTLEGSVVSMGEVMCRLPAVHRFTNQSEGKTDGSAADIGPAPFYRWDIQLTNDGSRYSNSLRFNVYDSKCQEHRQDGTFSQKADTCLIDGRCFGSGEVSRLNHCKKCVPSNSRNRWTHDDKGKVCPASATALSYSISILAAILISIFIIEI